MILSVPISLNLVQVYLSKFEDHGSDVGGDIFQFDSQSLLLRNFTYSGTGPDVFLIGGVSGEPGSSPDVVFPFPFPGQHLEFDDERIEKYPGFDGSRDILLTLPDNIEVSELRWLSVWCRQFGANFGEAFL